MCGIAGHYCNYHVDQSVIKRMTDAIAHRGPDAEGFYYNDHVALGHRRLSIIDLSSAANQPMHSTDGRWIIVFNGEVYNYSEVATSLNLILRTHSDTEVILESFVQLGIDAISKWNGMFAIALYDTVRSRLYLIRDRLGVKPLYYYFVNGDLYFASELKSLTSCSVVQKNLSINYSAIRSFLQLGYIPGPATIYNEIHKLPAGSYAEFDGQTFHITPYWSAEEQFYPTTITNEDDALLKLEELLTSSVKYRMIADVPYGSFLSGGIDSSLITALSQRLSDKPIKTFSIAFNESRFNEAQYARAVASHLRTDHHEFTVTESEALDLVETMLDAYDEPYADSSGIPTMLVSKLARQKVTMVLSGDGGDELFMGYGAYQWADRLSQSYIKLAHNPIAQLLKLGNERMQRASHVFDFDNANTLPEHIFSQEQYLFSNKELNRLLKFHNNPIALNYRSVKSRQLSPSGLQSFFDLKYYLCDDLLTKVDIASMQYALEVRVPLLDYRVVEFALNLDDSLKRRPGITKYLLKQVLYKYVPQHIFDRPKWGFSIPLAKWLQGDLMYLIKEHLSDENLNKFNLVNPLVAAHYRDAFLAGKSYYYNRVWSLMILHRWMGKHSN
ncbi:MAG: asparagine synthase (glutamine-hydrolyzing) [Bacteroidetes bacterium]|nr:asparagine synthase (glutamine-hydrolyzing) [Bacteroidota bacterium]